MASKQVVHVRMVESVLTQGAREIANSDIALSVVRYLQHGSQTSPPHTCSTRAALGCY